MKELLAKYNNYAIEIFSDWSSPITEAQECLTINSFASDATNSKNCMQKSLNKRDAFSSIDTFRSTSAPTNTKKSSISYNLHKPSKTIFSKQWLTNRNSALKGPYKIDKDLKHNNIYNKISGKDQGLKQSLDILHNDLI